MARSQNPMDVHRRQERKKQLQKNKTTRITARDQAVKQTKTVQQVKDAIRVLEKRKAHLSHSEKQKLDRLYKELKLTKQAQEEKKQSGGSGIPLPVQQQPLTELDDPRKSVYWDKVMNPYGAPPPGKPRLYHRRGGGVTMDMREAVVPGEEPEAAIPPPPPPRREESQQSHQQQSQYHQQQQQPQTSVPPPPPPPPSSRQAPVPPPPPPPPLPKEEAPPKAPTNSVPSLPPPSKAVARMSKKKRKLAADIWASTEEVDYHKQHHHLDLESTSNQNDTWWYRDNTTGNMQGPFTSQQMQAWHQAGFFPPTTPVQKGDLSSQNNSVEISQIDWNAQVSKVTGKRKNKKKKKTIKENSDVDDRIAALRDQEKEATMTESSAEDRIAALRRENEQQEEHDSALRAEENKTAEESSVDERIAAFRGVNERQEEEEVNTVDDRIAALRAQENEAAEESTDVDDRITALRRENEQQEEQDVDSVDARIAALKAERAKEMNQEETDLSVQARINALRNETLAEQHVEASDEPMEATQMEEMPSYPVELDVHEGPQQHEEPPPAYYPLPEDMGEGGGDAVAPYPSDLDYPVSDSYPVNDAYPVDDGDADAYPVVAPYPTEEDVSGAAADAIAQPPKKVYKADKEVVGLVPTNLQKRRATKKTTKAASKERLSTAAATPDRSTATKSKSVADDYEAFMSEINDLK